ncbi:MAG TPA: cell surface protein SprA [Paludibacteraceae bacterium]|nr:cell surface protein SprA [Paludibacteraceae bacterium]
MFFKKKIFPVIILLTALVGTAYGLAGSSGSYDFDAAPDMQQPKSQADTITRFPVSNQRQETYEDLNKQYPMDLRNPENVNSVVEYDVKTGNYVLRTKVGDMEISTPYMLTPAEYQKYSLQNDMMKYWREKNSATAKNNEDKFSVTDMKFSLGPADKIFGPGGVQLKTQGSAELIFGFKSNFIDNPALTERARRSNIPNFDQKIQLNVNGKVGDKINFGLNYNTEASFDFDQKLVKLSYKGKEDDIFQNIEAGNVSMQLNSSLITGSTALFGIKTDMQFGKLKVSAIASQQESQSQSVSSKGGSQTIPFEVPIDQYDDNRHFFLSHFFRNNYETALSKLPFISSGVIINRVEVWITNKRGNFDQARNVLAFMDLAETDSIDNKHWQPTGSTKLPGNKSNTLYDEVTAITGVRDVKQSNALLASRYGSLDINGGEDYEKIESARRLDPSEFTFNQSLGYISLRSSLNPDEVLAVAYEYSYGGKIYQVGEFSTDGVTAPDALVLKLLKSTTQSPQLKTWDLMMKNVYSIGAMQMQKEDFELNVMYQNDSVGTMLQYLTEGEIANKRLLTVMNLDRLDKKNEINPDGNFDYVEDITAQSSSGRIIFPVLEPFGSHLTKKLNNAALSKKYVYQELYDSTLVVAQEYSEKNKFLLVGRYKGSANGSEISLNAMNVPRGSVVVTAGGATLTENVDYTVDYTMGTVTILNQSILESNTNIDVKLENQSMFSMQRKSLTGTHLEYLFSKDFSLGGTIMHLSEMPLTKKVNTGSEPIKNTIWGLNTAWRTESQWLTNMLDKLPFVNATQPSNITFNAEFAQLLPGHSDVISNAGLAYLDDFESTKTNIDIHYPYYWYLASTPGLFPESSLSDNVEYGKNRALMSWYFVDPVLNGESRQTPPNLRGNAELQSDHRTRQVRETELFPNKDLDPTRSSLLSVLNLSYYPSQRGPYNLDVDGMNSDGTLLNPKDRWGGIMRRLETTDFETANIEYIEFWMMDPFIADKSNEAGGDLYFNLGDISEDILKDGKKAFEHGLPINEGDANTTSTVWGRIPTTQSTVTAFDNAAGARINQDVGLNGLSTRQEFDFPAYKDYVEKLTKKLTPEAVSRMQNDPFSPLKDPAGDDYHFYRGTDYDEQKLNIVERYKYYNGTEGNSPATENTGETYSTSATLLPDMEDINSDNTLNEYEKYYQYKVALRPGTMKIGSNYITDILDANVTLKNGKTETVRWYQFKIPVREYDDKVGSIRNFKSIRFIRMFLTNFSRETHLRFGTLDLVRGEWKTYTKPLNALNAATASSSKLDVLAVNIEENGRKNPVNYVLPPGITRETDPSQPQLLQQNEQSMVMRVTDLSAGEARAVYKNTTYDMRKYKRLQMFVHGEAMVDAAAQAQNLKDYELSCFIRFGSDMVNNYYEYEIPLKLTKPGVYLTDKLADREEVWQPQNMFDFPFTVLTDAKLKRNKARQQGQTGVSNTTPFVVFDENNQNNKITVVGNPTISEVENIMIGIRNVSGNVKSGEVWVNEMRMSEFDENAGWAGIANLSVGLSDLGSVNVSGRAETSGFGGLESTITNRSMDDTYQMNLSAALDLGRFLPEQAKLQIPAYFTYTTETVSPKYNPLDNDILLKDALDNLQSKLEKDSLKNVSQSVVTTKSFNVTNAKINVKSKKPKFYDPANITFSISSNETDEHTPEIFQNLTKQQRAAANYSFSFNNEPWEPFKKSKGMKSPALKLIKEFNVYYLPTSLSYNTSLNRAYSQILLRDLLTGVSPLSQSTSSGSISSSKDFMWNRQFDIQYNITRGLKVGLQTAMNANIAEPQFTPEIGKEYYEQWRDTVWYNIKKMGTPYTYQQVFDASWKIPIDKLPLLDWITSNAQYNSTYSWNRSATMEGGTDIGNVASSMGSMSLDGTLNFETLYNKVKYLKDVNARSQASLRPQNFVSKTYRQTVNLKAGTPLTVNHALGSQRLLLTAKDKNGKTVSLKYTVKNAGTIELNPTTDAESVAITLVSQNPNSRSAGQQFTDFTTRLLMSVRRASVTYRQTSSLTMPGFRYQPGILGLQTVDGLSAPGWGYVFGYHDNNTLKNAADNGWLYMGTDVINPANEALTSDLDVRASIEPIAGFKIDLTAKRQTASNTVIHYMYEGMPSTFNGNFNITQIALATTFDKIGTADQNYSSKTFDKFLANRQIIADRLNGKYTGTRYPSTGFFNESPDYANKEYDAANGTFGLNSPDVLIPAFLSAYTGRDPNAVSTNPFLSILEMLPNWSLNFNGLSNIGWVKEKVRSVSINHAYTNRYTIGNYSSFSTWVPMDGDNSALGYIRDVQNNTPIPSSPYDISTVSLNESFSPLIGVNVAMKNSMTATAKYNKQRNLSLNLTSTQLIEADADEFVVGVGYVVNDFDVVMKMKSSKRQTVKNDLKLNADFSYKDIKTLLRKVNENITQASSGNKVVSIKFTADYVFSSKVNLQLFFDRQMTAPLVSSTFPVSSTNFGLSFKFLLAR